MDGVVTAVRRRVEAGFRPFEPRPESRVEDRRDVGRQAVEQPASGDGRRLEAEPLQPATDGQLDAQRPIEDYEANGQVIERDALALEEEVGGTRARAEADEGGEEDEERRENS